MTDPAAHNSPSECDDDREGASRDSCPPETNETVSPVDLDAIEQWARGSTIVAARAHIPGLVRELRDARAELARLRAQLADASAVRPPGLCLGCDGQQAEDGTACVGCGGKGRDPDPTVPGQPGERVERRG